MQPALIGVDIGTTNIKAVAFALNGSELAKTSIPTQTHYPRPEWAYYEPEEIWRAICTVLRQIVQQLPTGVTPASIAFASMGEAAVPVDAQGNPTYPAIAWFDRRTQPQLAWWREHVGEETVARIAGLPFNPIFGVNKLMWLRDNEPDAFRRTVRWLNMADYGAFRLSGAQATDYSLASRTMVLDVAQVRWSAHLLDAVGFDHSLFAELVPSGTQVGRVHATAAAETGLPIGLPVASGGHDHVCGALALGISEPGDLFDSMGTAESLFVAAEKAQPGPEVVAVGLAQGIHTAPNRAYIMGGVYFSGGCVDWVRQLLLSHGNGSYETLLAMAADAPLGSGGVTFLPHLRGGNPPHIDPQSRGAFIGLSSDTGPGHVARAVLEGLAYEYQQAYDSMVKTFGFSPGRILATGGGARNPLWLRIKASLMGRPLTIAQVDEAVCLGAAMLGGVGAGVYAGFEDAAARVRYATEVVEPDVTWHELYQARYREVFLPLYGVLRDVNHVVSGRFVG